MLFLRMYRAVFKGAGFRSHLLVHPKRSIGIGADVGVV
jgi:hypothetical protein